MIRKPPRLSTQRHVLAFVNLSMTYLAALELAGKVRRELGREIEAARADGHSFPQLNEASGLSTATIQKILVAAGVERASSKS